MSVVTSERRGLLQHTGWSFLTSERSGWPVLTSERLVLLYSVSCTGWSGLTQCGGCIFIETFHETWLFVSSKTSELSGESVLNQRVGWSVLCHEVCGCLYLRLHISLNMVAGHKGLNCFGGVSDIVVRFLFVCLFVCFFFIVQIASFS